MEQLTEAKMVLLTITVSTTLIHVTENVIIARKIVLEHKLTYLPLN